METLNVGNKIKKLRELRNFTQDYMADALQMSQAGYGKIERDETDISLSRLQQIAEVLNVGLNDLIGFDEKMVFYGAMNNHATANGGIFLGKDNFDKERKLYEEQIKQLQDHVHYLKELLDKVLSK
jgi:transcriptional regulator with XRE-family HTH domain